MRNRNSRHSACSYLNLLTMTATIKMTKTVMMEIVITRFVAILGILVSSWFLRKGGSNQRAQYLRAIPLNVLTLLST